MFTIKLYGADGYRQIIKEADSFTILRGENGEAEITLHQKNGEDSRVDIKDESAKVTSVYAPRCFEKAIIENSAGRTTEIIDLHNPPKNLAPREMPKSYGESPHMGNIKAA